MRTLSLAAQAHLEARRLERRLTAASHRMARASTREEQLDAWRDLQRLHVKRTPGQVAGLERQRGLAR